MNVSFDHDGPPADAAFDEALRGTLHAYAAPISAPAALAETTALAGRRRRRRTITTSALGIAVVAAIGIGVPLGLLNTEHRDSVRPIAPPTNNPAPPSVLPSSPPASIPADPTPDALTWTFRGDAAVRQVLKPAAQQHISAAYPGATISDLWAGTTPSGGWTGYIFRVTIPGHPSRLGVWTARTDGSTGSLVRDDLLQPGTIEIDQQLPADPTNMLVVLAPPTATSLEYDPDHGGTQEIQINNGVAFFNLSGQFTGDRADQITLFDDQVAHRTTYLAPLSAGGFVVLSGPSSSSRELVVNGLFQAWLAGDRTAANAYGTASAITQLFAIAPPASAFAGGACTTGTAPATCGFVSQNGGELRFTVDGEASAGYRVTSIKLTGKA